MRPSASTGSASAPPAPRCSTGSGSTSIMSSKRPPSSSPPPEEQPMDRLAHLYHEFGQSPWLDNLKRNYITGGQLDRLIGHGIRGLTSNPTIFQKAIQGSADYDEQFKELAADDKPIIDDYWAMVLRDINSALDLFAPVYHDSYGGDGFV